MELRAQAAPGPLALFCVRLKRLKEASGISQAQLLSAAHLGKVRARARRKPGSPWDWDDLD
jgi:hypothetical protein